MFKWAYDLNGVKVPFMQPMLIATGTAIELGEAVLYTPAVGVAAVLGTDFDDPAMGVAAEAHDGATAGRQVGTEIKVFNSPSAIFSIKPRVAITATGGSTTTFVDSSLFPATDNYFNGGYIQVLTCAADSTLVGRRIKISDHTGTGGTLTLAETMPAVFAAGDTAYLCPGAGAVSAFGWDLDSDGTDIDWETSGGEALQIVDVDPENFTIYVKFRLHQLGNGPIGI